MTIELTRKHAVLFTLLLLMQTLGLGISLSRSPALSPRLVWFLLFPMLPGSAFLTTIIIIELIQSAFPKNR